MVLLAVDTATSSPSVAIFKDRTLLASAVCQPGQSLTSQLLPTIDRLLVSVGIRVSDLQGLAVSLGPGSFTGLRVGLASMTALRVALQIPLAGVPTLEGLAWNVEPSPLRIFSTVFIKPGSLYWGIYEWVNGALVRKGDEAMGTVNEALQSLEGEFLIVGDGWSRNQELFASSGAPVFFTASEPFRTTAQGIGLAGLGLLERGQLLPAGSTPHYLQLSYAEVAMPIHKTSG